MKKKAESIGCLILIVVFFISPSLNAQHEVSLSAGIGIPEAINLGLHYRMSQFQTGFTVGTLFSSNESLLALSADVRYHFKGHSRFTDLRPWYGKFGFNYLRDETPARIEKFVYLNTRIGRVFNMSPRWGLELEAGAVFLLSKSVIRKTDPNWYIPMNWKVIPGLSMAIFYKL